MAGDSRTVGKYLVVGILVIIEFALSAAYFGHLPARNGTYLDAYSVWQKDPTPENSEALRQATEKFRKAEEHTLRVLRLLLFTNTFLIVILVSVHFARRKGLGKLAT